MPGYDQDIKVNTKFLKILAGDPHNLRLLNPEPFEIYTHQLKPPEKPVVCSRTDSCPLCQKGHEPNQRFLTNVYDYNSKKVKVWEYGSMIGKQLKEIYKTLLEEDRRIVDVDLKVTATGDNLMKRYQITPRGKSQVVPAGLKVYDLTGNGKELETSDDTPDETTGDAEMPELPNDPGEPF